MEIRNKYPFMFFHVIQNDEEIDKDINHKI